MKGKLFIRLLNADKNRDYTEGVWFITKSEILRLVLYYLAGEKDGYILSAKDQEKHFLETMGKRSGY